MLLMTNFNIIQRIQLVLSNFNFALFCLLFLNTMNRMSASDGWNGTICVSNARSTGQISMYRWSCTVWWVHRLPWGRRWGTAGMYVLQNGKCPDSVFMLALHSFQLSSVNTNIPIQIHLFGRVIWISYQKYVTFYVWEAILKPVCLRIR